MAHAPAGFWRGTYGSSRAVAWETDILDRLKSLHTSAIDARNDYREAMEDAGSQGMTPLFREMNALHEGNADELRRELVAAG